LQNYIEEKFFYTFQQESVGKLNLLALGIQNFKILDKTKSNLYYIVGAENIKTINSKDFVIFQGHHNDKIRMKFDIILPTVT
jgi:NADH dehydrogenase/NADH:ubiquinone oxidoreductase subunit G